MTLAWVRRDIRIGSVKLQISSRRSLYNQNGVDAMVDIFFKDRTLIFTSRFIALRDIGAELYISLDQRKKYKIFHWKSKKVKTI